VSFTTDLWSDPDIKYYMAVTAHWLELVHLQGGQKKITIRADLIGFIHVPGQHTGEKLAKIFHFIISRVGLIKKGKILFYFRSIADVYILQIGWVTTDNASNNSTMLHALEDLIKSNHPNSGYSAQFGHIR
jgi:hypothetical protein